MESTRKDLAGSAGLLILRLGIGGYMLTHGWGKLQMVIAGNFAKFGDPIGLGSGVTLGAALERTRSPAWTRSRSRPRWSKRRRSSRRRTCAPSTIRGRA